MKSKVMVRIYIHPLGSFLEDLFSLNMTKDDGDESNDEVHLSIPSEDENKTDSNVNEVVHNE